MWYTEEVRALADTMPGLHVLIRDGRLFF